jgi:hypothetical protein
MTEMCCELYPFVLLMCLVDLLQYVYGFRCEKAETIPCNHANLHVGGRDRRMGAQIADQTFDHLYNKMLRARFMLLLSSATPHISLGIRTHQESSPRYTWL